jgi:hypothetical protein
MQSASELMNYSQLVQTYFDRCNALQWYWTVYILVIGGVLAFSAFRQHKEIVTTLLVIILYCCFAYKNLGAIEATLMERQAFVSAITDYPGPNLKPADQRIRDLVQPALITQTYEGVRNFHIGCDLLTVLFLVAREIRRGKVEPRM